MTYEEVKAIYDKYYKDEKFVRVLEKDVCPETKWVEGSNYVDINFKIDPRTNRIIMMGAIDNPGKRCGRTGSTEYEPDVRTSGDRRSGTGANVPINFRKKDADKMKCKGSIILSSSENTGRGEKNNTYEYKSNDN